MLRLQSQDLSSYSRTGLLLEKMGKVNTSCFDYKKSGRTAPKKSMARTKVNAKSWPSFYRNMATLFNAGISVSKSFDLLGKQTDDKTLSEVCKRLLKSVQQGEQISFAMSQEGNVFPWFYQRLVAVGEESGSLPIVMNKIANYEEKRYAVTQRIKSMLTYPSLLVSVVSLLFILAPYHFESIFRDVLQSAGQTLPLHMKVIFAVSGLANSWMFWLALAVVGALIYPLTNLVSFRRKFRALGWGFVMKVPGISDALNTLSRERFARALSIQLAAGVKLEQAIRMSFDSTDNPLYIKHAREVVDSVRNGTDLVLALEATGLFDRTFLSMVEVGQTSGQTPELMMRTADFCAENLENNMEAALAAAEPTILLFAGVCVGGFVLSLMLPLSQAIQALA